MQVTRQVNALFHSVSYRIGTALVDAGDMWRGFWGVKAVLVTHAHFDHIYGLNELLRVSSEAEVYTNECGREMLLDARKNLSYYNGTPFVFAYPERIDVVEDGGEVELGEGLMGRAVFTPGHNPSCITWMVGDALFTGDSYIIGTKTVTNLPGGDKTLAGLSEGIIRRLAVCKDVYPGHRLQESY